MPTLAVTYFHTDRFSRKVTELINVWITRKGKYQAFPGIERAVMSVILSSSTVAIKTTAVDQK